LEKNEIIALIEALCERPLGASQAEPPAELQAFCREAAKALSQAGDIDMEAGRSLETIADSDRLVAALATLLSGSNVEAARRTLVDAARRSDTVRLDAEATLAFVDAIEQSPQVAPAHLVEELLVADALTMHRAGVVRSSLWSRMVGGVWPARRWRMAGACMVLLVAVLASWSAYWQQSNPVGGPPAPMAKTTSEQPAVADAPAPKPALAMTQPCEPRSQATEAAKDEISAPAGAPKANSDVRADCSAAPGHQLTDHSAEETDRVAARQQAERARQAAAARAAAEAGKVGTMQADREPGHGPVQADPSGRMFGTTEYNRPAATLSAPAAAPAARPTAPALSR
jgi:hypothetical protein